MRLPIDRLSVKAPAILLAAVTLFAIAPLFAGELGQQAQPSSSGQLIVKFKASAQNGSVTASSSTEARLARLLNKLNLPAGARLREPKWNLPHRPQGAAENESKTGFMLLDVPPGISVDKCLERLKNSPDLEYAETDGAAQAGGQPAPIIPSDLDFGFQWHHQNSLKPSACIHTPEAWSITTGSTEVVVAVLDSGVNTNLSKFSGRIVPGYNFVADNTDVSDDEGHGTITSTLLCAGNDGVGGVGVDWNCKLMPVKVLSESGVGNYSWFAQGINFAVANGAKIINLSAGGPGVSITVSNAINDAIAAGVIFVTITHNYGTNIISFPGTVPGAIAVGATDQHDVHCAFSDYGPQIALVAPGADIFSTGRSGAVELWAGTSCAAPQVAGVAALLCSLRPNLNQAQVRSLLCAGADDQIGDANDTPGFDNYYGAGRLNAYSSLQLAAAHIDVAQINNGQITLSWPVPENAAARKPFEIQFRALGDAKWVSVANTNSIAYQNGRGSWTGPAPKPGIFQLVIR